VNDILDISAIETGETPLAPVDLDMAMLFDECSRVVREQARSAKVELSVALPPADAFVYADHRAVRQILLNLLSNAIKFTPPGGEVSIGATDSDEIFAILVSDTGIGIPAEHLATITQPFETGSDDPHTSSKGNPYVRSKGTGLGLAIVRSLANLHAATLPSIVRKVSGRRFASGSRAAGEKPRKLRGLAREGLSSPQASYILGLQRAQ
tara:strand:+ start:943 stop:1569 length:627 start_codon:yes stop_codon:yes gene_type:complete